MRFGAFTPASQSPVGERIDDPLLELSATRVMSTDVLALPICEFRASNSTRIVADRSFADARDAYTMVLIAGSPNLPERAWPE
jgi:hypothetical protein